MPATYGVDRSERGQQFGYRVAAGAGMTVVAGRSDPLVTDPVQNEFLRNGNGLKGHVYVYDSSDDSGNYLDLVSNRTDDSFGAAVAISDKWLVVGAPTHINENLVQEYKTNDDIQSEWRTEAGYGGWRSANVRGAVWVCNTTALKILSGDGGADEPKVEKFDVTNATDICTRIDLPPPPPATQTPAGNAECSAPLRPMVVNNDNAEFGSSVATDGDNIVVADMKGRMWVLDATDLTNPSTWQEFQVATLHCTREGNPTVPSASPSLAIRDDLLLVGVPGDQQDGEVDNIQGSVYQYTKTGPEWSRAAHLKIDRTDDGSRLYGSSVAIFPDAKGFVVAAPRVGESVTKIDTPGSVFGPNAGSMRPGTVYVYERGSAEHVKELRGDRILIVPRGGTPNDEFGDSVATYSTAGRDVVVVGGPYYGDDSEGGVYLFARNGTDGTWDETKLKTSSLKTTDQITERNNFGHSVAVDIDHAQLVVGIPNLEVGGLEKAGAVAVFDDINELLKCEGYQPRAREISWLEAGVDKISNATGISEFWVRKLLALTGAVLIIALIIVVWDKATAEPEPDLSDPLKATWANLAGARESIFSFGTRRAEGLTMQISTANTAEAYQMLQVLSSTSGATITTMLVQQLQAANYTGPMPSMVTTTIQSVTDASSSGSSSSNEYLIAVAIVVAAVLVLVAVLVVSALVYMYKLNKNEAPATQAGADAAPPAMGTVGVSMNPMHEKAQC